MSGGVDVALVRRAQPGDAGDLLALVGEHVRAERADVAVPADLAARLRRWTVQGRVEVFVAAPVGPGPGGPEPVGPGLLGYATLTRDVATWTGEEFGHLDCLFVREALRGQGIGALLLAHVLDRCRDLGLAGCQWQTPSWNSRAIAFYERHGAVHQTKERFTISLG